MSWLIIPTTTLKPKRGSGIGILVMMSGLRNTKKTMQVSDMGVIAEGVETQEQLEILREMECDCIQGYLYSKPIPASDFEKLFIV